MPAGYLAKKKPWVILPYHSGDLEAARRLMGWIRVLGKVNTTCLLLRDCKMKDDGGLKMLAARAFSHVEELATPHALLDERWPRGANWMFETACDRMAQVGFPFLWLEPDSVVIPPKSVGWFDALNAEYQATSNPFMGTIVTSKLPNQPERHLNGIAIYPASARDYFPTLPGLRETPWDLTTAKDIVPLSHDTALIQHFWGEPGLPPTFVPFRGKDDPKNALTLDFINDRAVMFHRCKDGSAIDLLRNRVARFSQATSAKIDQATLKLWHVVQRFPQRDEDAQRRVSFAFESWVRLYSRNFMPVHVWEFPRTSVQMGDDRKLPYLKDVLEVGLRRAGQNDAIMLTNDDTVLHPEILTAVQERLAKIPAFCSFRLNYPKGRAPHFGLPFAALGKPQDDDIGRDVFVFTKEWLLAHLGEVPDFLLGELEWDLLLAMVIRKSYGLPCSGKTIGRVEPVCELPKGYVWHERHTRAWINSGFYNPSKQHNWRLSSEWCKLHEIQYPFE